MEPADDLDEARSERRTQLRVAFALDAAGVLIAIAVVVLTAAMAPRDACSDHAALTSSATTLLLLQAAILLGLFLLTVVFAIPSGPRLPGVRRWSPLGVAVSGIGFVVVLGASLVAIYRLVAATLCITF